jgi:hypothetical protein
MDFALGGELKVKNTPALINVYVGLNDCAVRDYFILGSAMRNNSEVITD